jgi:hypothetical protein
MSLLVQRGVVVVGRYTEDVSSRPQVSNDDVVG